MSSLEPASKQVDRSDQYFVAAAVPLLGVLYMFSPLASYIGALLFLTLFSSRLNANVRIATSAIVILSGASIWASRQVGLSVSDDFASYYDMYTRIDHLEWTTERIPPYELGLPMFFRIVSVALPDLTPNGLMFVSTTVTGLILLFCVERFGLREFPREKRAYCLAMVFLFFSFVLTTQLTRQMLSSVLLVNAFFCVRATARRLSLLVASLFHLAAIPVYAVLRMLQGRFLLLVIALLSAVVLANLVDVEAAESWVTRYGVPRVGYYLTLTNGESNRMSFLIVLGVAMAGVMSLLAVKAARAQISSQEKRTMLLLIGVVVVYLLTMGLTLGPFRLFLVVHAVMAGWFFAYFTRRFPNRYLAVVGAALIIALNLWRGRTLYVVDAAREFLPWEVYGPFGALPGYFVLSYLSR